MTINCGMDNLYIHMMKHRFQLKKNPIGDESQKSQY